MITINSIYFKLIFLMTVMTCFLCLTGCSESTQTGSNVYPRTSELTFEEQTNLTPTTKTLYTMAELLAAQGKEQECEFTLKRIIQQDPEYLPAYNSLAELKMRQGNIKTAIETLNQAFRFSPDDPILLNNLGLCFLVLGDYEQALGIFTQAAGTVPENARYRANMAVALGLIGRYEEAFSLFEQVLPSEQADNNLSILMEKQEIQNPSSD